MPERSQTRRKEKGQWIAICLGLLVGEVDCFLTDIHLPSFGD
jgi:hypothetical protein